VTSSLAGGDRPGSLALGALVFGAGIGALATEITASRLLAPYFGSSTVVWANLIGIVLAALALGYWLGGRLADRRPEPALLGYIVLAAALCIAVIPFAARPFLDVTVEGLDTASAGAVVGSFLAVVVLCAPPVVLLGMVSPFAIRLAVSSITTAGAVAGRLYALSTAGSLVGTFLPALVLIPGIGTQRTFLAIAALVAASSCFLLGARYLVVSAVLAGLLLVPPGAIKGEKGLIHEETSRYQYIAVVQRPDGRRVLHLNEGLVIHSLWRPGSVLTGGEWDTYLAVPPLLGRPLERVAILGNAAGTTARALGVYYPEADVDGVELDPGVTRVGRRYFGLGDNPRLTVHTADARPFLRSADTRYDLIVVDAYRQPYVPFYLATREFFRLVRDHLTPGGIVVLNVAAVPDDKRLVSAIGGTLATELPQVLEWPALRFNSFLLGFTKPLSPAERDRRLESGPRDVAPLRDLLAREARAVEPSQHPWTDDRAPVEWLTDRMIVEYAAEGGRIEEDYLPTRPAP
jgi:predicted membrane-bound spermidine synthase